VADPSSGGHEEHEVFVGAGLKPALVAPLKNLRERKFLRIEI
jgi:hypothetical protein